MTEFPVFNYPFEDILPYPRPLSYVSSVFSTSTPTNSWMQNAISDNTDPQFRFFNQLPWYATIYYPDTQGDSFLGLTHQRFATKTQDVTDGNLGEIDEYAPAILFSRTESKPVLSKYSDLGCQFSSQDGLEINITRGSPLVSFVSTTPTTIQFQSGVIVEETSAGIHEITTMKPSTTLTHFIKRERVISSDTIRGAISSENIENGPENEVSFLVTPTSYAFSLKVSNFFYRGNVVFNGTPSMTNVSSNGISLVNITGSSSALVVTLSFTYMGVDYITAITLIISNDTLDMSTSTTYQRIERYTLLTSSTVSSSGSTVTVDGNFQIAEGVKSYYADYLNVYSTESSVSFVSETTTRYTYNSNNLLYIPRSWEESTITEPLVNTGDVFTSTTYGPMSLYRCPPQITVQFPYSVPGLLPTGRTPGFSQTGPVDRQILLATLPLVDQYAFGTRAYAACRLLLLARNEGVEYPDLLKAVDDNMRLWLSSTNVIPPPPTTCSRPSQGPPNTQMFLLQREEYWGGIISPADYYLYYYQCYYPLGGFFNSYYTDHHFQWGYFYYTLAVLQELGSTILTDYRERVESLLLDVVNPVSDVNATRTRHKDWYVGHSWATGIQPTLPVTSPNAAISGPIERNEESLGEAVNSYYSAYHLAIKLGRNDIAVAAACCYSSEVISGQQYNFNNSTGFMERTPTISLLGNRYRKSDVLFGSQPADYWGRMNSINDILFVPFGENKPQLIESGWNLKVQQSHQDPFTGNESYQVTLEKLQSLFTNYQPALAVNEVPAVPPADTFTAYTPDMLLMLKLLASTPNTLPSVIQSIFNTALHQQTLNMNVPAIKAMDSYSNTAYWLNYYNKLVRYNTNFLLVSSQQGSQQPTSCEFPPVTYCSLLENSTIEGKVDVPHIYALVCLDDQRFVRQAKFRVIDDRSYRKCCPSRERRGPCREFAACPQDIIITDFSQDNICLNYIDYPGTTFWEKAQNIGQGVTGESLITYTTFRLFLSKLLWGKFNCKYLEQRYHTRFEQDMARSRFCRFLNTPEWAAIRDYWRFFI